MKLLVAAFAIFLWAAPAFAQEDMSSEVDQVASDAAALQQSQDADAQNGGDVSLSTTLAQSQLNEDKFQAQDIAIENAYLGD